MKITRLGWTAYAIAAAVLVLDQLSKLWILGLLGREQGASLALLGPLHLTMVHNYGMSFGLLKNSDWGRWLLTGFSIVVVVALAVWARKSRKLLTEVVFAYPGVGYQLLSAVQNLDYPLMQGLFLTITTAVLVANFLVDIVYVRLDPRVRVS